MRNAPVPRKPPSRGINFGQPTLAMFNLPGKSLPHAPPPQRALLADPTRGVRPVPRGPSTTSHTKVKVPGRPLTEQCPSVPAQTALSGGAPTRRLANLLMTGWQMLPPAPGHLVDCSPGPVQSVHERRTYWY